MKTKQKNESDNILFRKTIRRGTGKAFIMATRPGNKDFTKEIISACIRNFSYDGQCENSRASYLYRIIKVHGNQQKIKKAILKAILDEVKDTWTLTQLFDLARHFAKEGDSRFRDAIYQRFYTNTVAGSDWVGYEEIIDLDGLTGLQHIATVMGQGMMDDPDIWQDDMVINRFSEIYPHIDARFELEKLAVSSLQIKRYLSGIDEVKKLRAESRVVPEVYSNLLEEIKNRSTLFPLWKRSLSEEDLLPVAESLAKEKDPKCIEKMLHFFNFFKFPLEEDILLVYAKGRRNAKNHIAERAIDALAFISSEGVRDFVIDRLQNSRNPEDYTNLLIKNYKPGDSVLLSEIASKAKSDHVVEQLAQSYSRIYDANETKESFLPLYLVYNKMTCGNCRKSVVNAMIKNNVVPSDLFEEFQYDCNDEIRKIVETK